MKYKLHYIQYPGSDHPADFGDAPATTGLTEVWRTSNEGAVFVMEDEQGRFHLVRDENMQVRTATSGSGVEATGFTAVAVFTSKIAAYAALQLL